MQKAFLERLRELRKDPTVVVPECIGPEPRSIAKIRSKLSAMIGKKPGFLDKRDKGVVGAVAQAWSVADREEVPRMLEQKVGGQRRFFVQKGQVERQCTVGVQNYDYPPALLTAYRPIARKESLHFFAQPKVWCTGTHPSPPDAWWDSLAKKASITLAADGDDRACPHQKDPQVVLSFREGPQIRVCQTCGKKAGNLHQLIAGRYAGPRSRQPLEVTVRAADGQIIEPDTEVVAAYRGDVHQEAAVIQDALSKWVPKGQVWVAGGQVHQDMASWLNALGAEPWERTALQAMVPDGYAGPGVGVAGVLDELRDQLQKGLSVILDDADFLDEHAQMAVRDILRAAHEEARRRDQAGRLPPAEGVGTIGGFIDIVARTRIGEGKNAAIAEIRKATERGVPGLHLWTVLQALGGNLGLESRIGVENRAPAQTLVPLAKAIFEAEGEAYLEALRTYLVESGSGERVR